MYTYFLFLVNDVAVLHGIIHFYYLHKSEDFSCGMCTE